MLAEGATGTTLGSLDSIFLLSGDERSAALGALRQSVHGYDSLPERLDVDDPPSSPDTGAQRVPLDEVQDALDVWVREHTAGLTVDQFA